MKIDQLSEYMIEHIIHLPNFIYTFIIVGKVKV